MWHALTEGPTKSGSIKPAPPLPQRLCLKSAPPLPQRLIDRTGLSVGEEEVRMLLEPQAAGGRSRWAGVVLQRGKQRIVASLAAADSRLKEAALCSGLLGLAAAPTSPLTALWMIREGAVVDEAFVSSLTAVDTSPKVVRSWFVSGQTTVPFCGQFDLKRWVVDTRGVVATRPTYAHTEDDFTLWC